MWQRKKILRTAGIAFLVLLVGAGAFTLYLDHRVRTEFEGRRFALPARIYARPLELHAGLRLALPDVVDELRELGYKALIEKPDPARVRRRLVRAQRRAARRRLARLRVLGRAAAPRARCASPSTAASVCALTRQRRAGGGARAGRAAADRRHLPGGQRGPGAGAARRGAAATREGADRDRGPQLLHARRLRAARHGARGAQHRARTGCRAAARSRSSS